MHHENGHNACGEREKELHTKEFRQEAEQMRKIFPKDRRRNMDYLIQYDNKKDLSEFLADTYGILNAGISLNSKLIESRQQDLL